MTANHSYFFIFYLLSCFFICTKFWSFDSIDSNVYTKLPDNTIDLWQGSKNQFLVDLDVSWQLFRQ